MENPKILQTTNYSIFKFINFNRDFKSRQLEKLKKVLRVNNLLHLHPILVNEDMEVISGQHRLMAAKELRLPIFYMKTDVEYDHILDANNVQLRSSIMDIVKYYAVKDKLVDYLKLKEYLENCKVSTKAFFALYMGDAGTTTLEAIYYGRFILRYEDRLKNILESYEKFIDFAKERHLKPIKLFRTFNFCWAYRTLILNPLYEEERFFSKLEQRWFDLKPQFSKYEWLKCLLEIYNYRQTKNILKME
jgi:hypothetical protein